MVNAQVWFQNARAKYRRNLLKQEQDKQKPSTADCSAKSDKAGSEGGSSVGASKVHGSSNNAASGSNGRRLPQRTTHSPSLSDISSTPSSSELPPDELFDLDHSTSGSTILEMFGS